MAASLIRWLPPAAGPAPSRRGQHGRGFLSGCSQPPLRCRLAGPSTCMGLVWRPRVGRWAVQVPTPPTHTTHTHTNTNTRTPACAHTHTHHVRSLTVTACRHAHLFCRTTRPAGPATAGQGEGSRDPPPGPAGLGRWQQPPWQQWHRCSVSPVCIHSCRGRRREAVVGVACRRVQLPGSLAVAARRPAGGAEGRGGKAADWCPAPAIVSGQGIRRLGPHARYCIGAGQPGVASSGRGLCGVFATLFSAATSRCALRSVYTRSTHAVHTQYTRCTHAVHTQHTHCHQLMNPLECATAQDFLRAPWGGTNK